MELCGEDEVFSGIKAQAVAGPTGFQFEVEAVFINPPVEAWAEGPIIPDVAWGEGVEEAPADEGLYFAYKPTHLNNGAGARVRVLGPACIVEKVGLCEKGMFFPKGIFQKNIRSQAERVRFLAWVMCCGIYIGIGLIFCPHAQAQHGGFGKINGAYGIVFFAAQKVIAQHGGDAGDGGAVGAGGGIGDNAIGNGGAKVYGLIEEEAAELEAHIPVCFVGVFGEGDSGDEIVQGMHGAGGLSKIAHQRENEEARVEAQVWVKLNKGDSILNEEVRLPVAAFAPVYLLCNKQKAQFFMLSAENEACPAREKLRRAPIRPLVAQLKLWLQKNAECEVAILINIYFEGLGLQGGGGQQQSEGSPHKARATAECGKRGKSHEWFPLGANFL